MGIFRLVVGARRRRAVCAPGFRVSAPICVQARRLRRLSKSRSGWSRPWSRATAATRLVTPSLDSRRSRVLAHRRGRDEEGGRDLGVQPPAATWLGRGAPGSSAWGRRGVGRWGSACRGQGAHADMARSRSVKLPGRRSRKNGAEAVGAIAEANGDAVPLGWGEPAEAGLRRERVRLPVHDAEVVRTLRRCPERGRSPRRMAPRRAVDERVGPVLEDRADVVGGDQDGQALQPRGARGADDPGQGFRAPAGRGGPAAPGRRARGVASRNPCVRC